MLVNHVVSIEEKRNIQKKAFDEIERAKRRMDLIKQCMKNLGMDLPMTSYANFRDALFHFSKIYELSDEIEISNNAYALNEHLLRGLKDALVTLLINISSWIEVFCISYSKINDCISKHEAQYKLLEDINKWNVKYLNTVRGNLSLVYGYSESESSRICIVLCAEVLQRKYSDVVVEIRKFLHCFKNENHKIRSASSVLAKLFQSDDDFYSLIKEVNDFFEFARKSGVIGTYVLFSYLI